MHKSSSPHKSLITLFVIITLIAVLLGFFLYKILYSQDVPANKNVYELVAWSMVAVLLLIAISGTISVLTVTKQIRKLKDEASRFANGDLSRKIEVSGTDEVGQLAYAFNQMSDRLRASYQRIALEKQRDEILLESMGEGMIALDKKGQVGLINNNAVAMLNLEGKEVLGQLVYKAFALQNADGKKPLSAHDRPEMRALHTAKPQSNVFGFLIEGQKPLMLHINASPVIIDKKTAGAIVILRDVTHEREVDRMKTEFISLASHQLRTPLSAIKWYTEMLLAGDAGKLKKEQQEFAQNIYDSSERMIELVSSLLNISRIESGRIIIDPRPTDLKQLVDGIVNDLRAKTEEKQQSLIISVHKELPKINLDARLIGQVFLNLLTNAIKYTPQGGEISVFVSRKEDQIVAQVSDNGYGIPKQEQDKVFQKFFRAENAVKIETDGTGLGLYLIKSVVESSGGKIWFESAEGKGTTFWFSLPMSGMKAKTGEVTLDELK
ncbi:MAG TPA: ATP-binding protein [Candidatus Saccharimonadales bacterium]